MPGGFVETDGSGCGDIEGFFAAGLGDGDGVGAAGHEGGADALAFVAEDPGAGLGQAQAVEGVAGGVRAGGQEGHGQGGEVVGAQAFVQAQGKVRPHAGAQNLGRPKRGGAFEGQHLAHAQGGGAAQNSADVAGVLQAIEHHRGDGLERHHGAGCMPRLLAGHVDQETQRRRRFKGAALGHQHVAQDHDVGHIQGQGAQVRVIPSAAAENGGAWRPTPGQKSARQVIALQPDAPLTPIAGGVLHQAAQFLDPSVGGGVDQTGGKQGHDEEVSVTDEEEDRARASVARRTGAKDWRCCGQGPCSRKASWWAGVG